MAKIIKVEPGIFPVAYKSFEQAVSQKERRKFENQKLDMINGKVLAGYQFDGSNLILTFDNKINVIISIGDNSVIWSIESSFSGSEHLLNEEDVVFEYSDGLMKLWDWKSVLDKHIGKKIAFSPSDQFLFFYSEDKVEYMFSILINTNNMSDRFLHISEV